MLSGLPISVKTLFGRSLLSNMNYLTNSYKNVDLDDPNPGSSLVDNTSARRKSRSFSSSLKDDKDCSSSSCSFSIHGPRELENDSEEMIPRVLEDGSDSRSSLKRCHKNSGDCIGLKKRKTLGIRVETEQSMKIEESKSENTEQLTVLQKTNMISGTKQAGKRTLPKQVTDDAKKLKIDMKPPMKNLEHFRQFMIRKGIQRPSLRVLEEFTLLKMCETIYQHNQEILRQLRIKDMAFEALRTKYISLEKQISDLDIAQTKIFNDMRKVKEPRDVVPVKITRSVGLQVNMQPLKTKINLSEQVSLAPDPLDPITVSGPLKKLQHASTVTNRFSILPPQSSALTPAPALVTPSYGPTGTGIKTTLPKMSNDGQTRDESNSPIGNILQKSPTTRCGYSITKQASCLHYSDRLDR
ncbi:windei [Carabus blaptoides fortunei]